MDRLEARIRDYLAGHLELLEPGLTLVRKEYPLANEFGAGGYIDILARDRFGHWVVIELKRSDQAARAAIHELIKYVALLRSSRGVSLEQLRAMLLSTSWHELNIPFSEYLKDPTVPTDGFRIQALDDGTVTAVTPFSATQMDAPLQISSAQDVFLFERTGDRDRRLNRVVSAAASAGFSDFAIFSVDYEGGKDEIIYRHGLYFIFSSPFLRMSREQIRKAKRAMGWDRNIRVPDGNFLVHFRERIGFLEGSTTDLVSPEKLAGMLADGWRVTVSHRAGRYDANKDLLSDLDLISQATKTEGGAQYYLVRTVSPKYPASWEQMMRDAKLVLLGDDIWTRTFRKILSEIESQRPTATVSVSIYNPGQIVFALGKLFGHGDLRYLPMLQIVVADKEETVIYYGTLGWTGRPVGLTGEQWLNLAYGSKEQFIALQMSGGLYELEETARQYAELETFVLEARYAGTKNERMSWLTLQRGQLIRVSIDSIKVAAIEDYVAKNAAFGRSLVTHLGSFWLS